MTGAANAFAATPPAAGLMVHGVPTHLRLPWRFDPATARAEALALPSSLWHTHFNQGRHDGGWQALALRHAPAAPFDVFPIDVASSDYVDTPALDQCPALRAVLQTMGLPWKSVRLMQLQPGCEIKEHTDAGVCAARGEARLHVPLQTGEQVFFHVDGQRLPLRAGECWYVDVSRPHRVRNRGDQTRMHLVADAPVDMRLLEAMRAGDAGEPLPEAGDPWQAFLRFRELVGCDARQADQLYDITDPGAFMEASVRMGEAAGFHFEASDVESAMKAGRRAWVEQWML